ncbi:MAG: ATP-dependent Clp protease ATP-binding subunit ClpA, partial [Myxococcota bacterium]|nr:ATP-dependent Clp protease ATP-binding subunit ClpA [Myxococcota bacterium]
RSGDDEESFKRAFSPEFRNRLHARIRFAPLSEEVTVKIAGKLAGELCVQLAARDVEASFSEAAIEHLAKIGHDPLNGARPMQRVLRGQVKRALADELLFGRLAEGGVLRVDAAEGEFLFRINEETPAEKESSAGEAEEEK